MSNNICYNLEVFDNSIVEQIELRMIKPSKFPVRHDDSKDSTDFVNLKSSIQEHGLLQPIVVRPLEHGFEIIAGHRRFSACKSLRWRFISCRIQEFTDKQAYEVQLTENIQRKSMDPLEEAEAYQKYVVDYGWGGASVLAKKIGKSTEYVSHRMQLLKLPKNIQERVINNNMSVSQALEITTVDSSLKDELANEIISNNLTIKQIRQFKSNLIPKSEHQEFGKEKKSKELHILRKSTIALKVTLSRIDDLIDDAHKIPASKRVSLLECLMDLRRTTHDMIDKCIQQKKKYSA